MDSLAAMIVGVFLVQALGTGSAVIWLKVTLQRVCDDMTEMHRIHPRTGEVHGNPTEKRCHDPKEFCGNEVCLKRAVPPEN